jgi:hypothetical protein
MNLDSFNELAETPTPSTPGYWRLSAAAKMLGIPPELLWRGALDNTFPSLVRTLRPNDRGMRFVNAADVVRLLREGAR